jgi:2-oxoisovalerate dehydrogenase E1 component
MNSVKFICQTTKLPDDPITQLGKWVIWSRGHLTTEYDTVHWTSQHLTYREYTGRVKRYPMFDPPEYVNWRSDPGVIDEFESTLNRDPQRAQIISKLTEKQMLDMYAGLLRFRLHDITLARWVRQGIIAKAWLGTGEEAVTIGNVHALDRSTDKVGPMIRNAGACHEMGVPLADMLREYLATEDSPSRGKDLHIGSMANGVIAPASQVGALTTVFAGMGLAIKQRGEKAVVLTWIGDGATKTTAFHEGMNMAAVLHVPAIYVLQNNQIALGTPLEKHQAGPFTAWSKAYGVTGFSCAGNNVLDTYAATKLAADLARSGRGPVIVFAETFRMGGHATHDEKEAREICPPAMFEHWGKRDPIGMYESYLERRGIKKSALEEVEQRVIDELARAEKEALESRDTRMPNPESAIREVYASQDAAPAGTSSKPDRRKAGSTRRMPSR